MSIGGVSNLSTLNRTHETYNRVLKQLATGDKYPSAANGPAQYSILKKMDARIGAISQSNSNTQNANSMLATASGAVENTISSLSSLRESLLQAANGTNAGSDLATIQNSINQTISSINGTVSSATYNGMQLLDGSKSVMVAGEDGYENVELGNMSAQGLGLTDSQGNATINATDQSSISSALDAVDSALNAALDQATSLGAAQQGLEYRSANYTVQEEALASASSTMGDTDIAKAVTELRSADTQQQLALHATKMQMHNRASVLNLLS